jgi:uncharacterized protein (TIGR02270 family)
MRATVPIIVSQHHSDAVVLRNLRSSLVGAPHVKLRHLRRLDERLAAQLDGLGVAGAHGSALCVSGLETSGPNEVFVATVMALEHGDSSGLDNVLALAATLPEARKGLLSAFGWVSGQWLTGTIERALASIDPFRNLVGIVACSMHQVDPAGKLNIAMEANDVLLRSRAFRVAGVLGRLELLWLCVEHDRDEDPHCVFWAAWSGVLLGNRGQSLGRLRQLCLLPVPHQTHAIRLVLKLENNQGANTLLQRLANNPSNKRALLRGVGVSGDALYVPWLIEQMNELKYARLAGESFSYITGLDLAYLDLETKPSDNFEAGPNDNADDDNVAMDEDDGLPWPDPVKLQAWWDVNHQRFEPGVRYFMGERVTVAHCKKVLRDGFQRQRVAAAEYLCLLTPGTPLFPTSAPAWRQQRWLRQME